jgi:hypothetical protein
MAGLIAFKKFRPAEFEIEPKVETLETKVQTVQAASKFQGGG